MTVLLITNNYPPGLGGVSRYYAGLVSAARGHIHVSGVDIPEGFSSRAGMRGRLSEIAQARRISRTYSRDYAVLAGQPHMALGSLLAGVPFGLILHGGEWQDYPKGQVMLDRLLSRARVIGCNSSATRDEWIPTRLHDKVLVIHPGTPAFVDGADRATGNGRVGPFRILAVSRLSPRKGLDRLITAVESCAATGMDVRLDVVGEGSEWARLSSLITMPNRVFLHGRVDDDSLRGYYASADLFALLPHRIPGGETWEGYGIVYLEAASFGLPILATRTGGVAEALSAEGSIALDENCSADAIATQLFDLQANSERRDRMARANRHWALSQDWSTRMSLVEELVDRLEAGRR